jgi:AcrR family transcriptional regulator
MRYDDNHKEPTRARVLAEAAAAIRSKGVERVGVAEVIAGAGLTHGGFYAHFKSKDDLLAEAISYMFDASYGWFLRHTEGRAPADALSNYIFVESTLIRSAFSWVVGFAIMAAHNAGARAPSGTLQPPPSALSSRTSVLPDVEARFTRRRCVRPSRPPSDASGRRETP